MASSTAYRPRGRQELQECLCKHAIGTATVGRVGAGTIFTHYYYCYYYYYYYYSRTSGRSWQRSKRRREFMRV